MPDTQEFHTKEDAVDFAKKQLESGVSPTSIAYAAKLPTPRLVRAFPFPA